MTKANSEIGRLISSDRFHQLQKLGRRDDQFSLLRMIDREIKENAWSRILAFFFRSRENHGLKKLPLLTWLRMTKIDRRIIEIVRRPSIDVLVDLEWETPEGRRLDLLVRVVDSQGNILAVVGVENKIWSGEQPRQLIDYHPD